MNQKLKELLQKYKKDIEFEFEPKDAMTISNKGLEEQLLVLFLTYNLVGETKKSISYIREGLTIPKTNDNYIHFLNLNNDGDLVMVNVNQTRKSESGVQQIKNQISGILRNVFQLEKSNKTFAEKSFVDHYNNLIETMDEDFEESTRLVYVLTDYELNDKEAKEVDDYANTSASDYENLSVFVVDIIRFFKEKTKDTVIANRRASFTIFPKSNSINFENKNEKAVVLNISAQSLKKVFQQFGVDLFDFNLRYFINTKAQDSEVVKTIKNNPEDFWLFNNGLVITCDRFTANEKSIDVDNITIVNGGQTTSIIGNTEFDHDFPVLAKVIAIENTNKEKIDRMTEIAVYANSQKPIKPRDLKANTLEQRSLQKLMEEHDVFVAIKRGEKPTIQTIEAWQETTNEELGQLILAGFLQMPGTARSQKSSIFKKNYEVIFKRPGHYPPAYLIDLLKLYNFIASIEYKDRNYYGIKAGVFANSKLFIFAALVYLLTNSNGEKLDHKLYKRNVDEKPSRMIRILEIENEEKILSLTDQLVELISQGYTQMKRSEFANESYPISNFTKLDSNYETYVLSKLDEIN